MVVNTYARRSGSATSYIDGRCADIAVETLGNGPVSVLGMSLEKNKPGVQYINLGISGAAAYITKVWSDSIVRRDIAQMDPDLIILGYGSNEAFNTGLSERSYSKTVRNLVRKLTSAAPDASLLIIGPADAAKSRASRSGDNIICGRDSKGRTWRTLPPSVFTEELLLVTVIKTRICPHPMAADFVCDN